MARILVVDDDPLICTAIRACGGRTGLSALESATFDVMIIDIFMPEMNGFESIRTFHQRAPKVPIIAISGLMFRDHHGPAPDFLRMSTHLGAAHCLRKPFRPEDLLRAVEQCMPGHAGGQIMERRASGPA